MQVTRCAGEDPAPVDPTAQQLYELVATGTVDGEDVTMTADEFRSDSGDATAVTQTVTITSGEGNATVGLQAKRSHVDDHWVDLNDPSVDRPLFDRSGGTLSVVARFGPQGSREGDEGIVKGALIAGCPEGGGG